MKSGILLNKSIYISISLLSCIFCFSVSSSQGLQKDFVNEALIYGHYSYGLNVTDTSNTIEIIYDSKYHHHITIIKFDDQGRIKHLKTPLMESQYLYSGNTINKQVIGNKYGGLLADKSYSVVFYINDNGRIDSALANSENVNVCINYDYGSIENVIRIQLSDKMNISNRTEIFLTDSSTFQQWETINLFGGISLNYSRMIHSHTYLTKIPNDKSVLYGVLIPDYKLSTTHPYNKFILSNSQGEELARIEIIK